MRQVAASPDAIAVIDAHSQLSYAQLGARSARVANYLLSRAGHRGELVAVCARRSTELLVALLGIWRAGLGYVPLDPEHPRDRLAWQLADTGADLVLTDQQVAHVVGDLGAETVNLDSSLFAAFPETDPRGVRLSSGSAAYAIYTSGSTGRPKGVVIGHGGIANRVLWTVGEHALGDTDRVLQKTALTFDAACWELFAPLVSGGTVVMAAPGAERDPAALVRGLAEHRVTVLQVVPSVLRLLVEEPDWRGCESLRLVLSAGEPLHSELCQRLLERVKCEVWNTYGPTECSIDATAHHFDPVQLSGPVPIGRPIDNVRILVLDERGRPVPIGVPGELHIGGPGLARGYLGRSALTAERFIPDPYGLPGGRLYRTGDLARWLSDGTLSYLGRIDAQVKINGVRIEPGEVEAALLRHPDITAAAVKATTDASGRSRLIAYLLERDLEADLGADLGRGLEDTEPLRAFLADHLPQALIPAAFVRLAAFPMTSSGKLDRGALPDLDPGRPAYVAPRTATEQAVAEVWARLLGVDRVGAHDEFFQLGGSSLLITRLAGELGRATGTEPGVPELFRAATVAAQARLITAQPDGLAVQPDGRAAPLGGLAVGLGSRGRGLPLSSGQRRQWYLDRLQPGSREWVAPTFLSLPDDLDVATIQRALDALRARHETLRTRYVVGADGEPEQLIEPPGPLPLRVAYGELDQLFAAEFGGGFDLEREPPVRALLAVRPDGHRVLLLTMHHIACDGWSTVILEREFREVCRAVQENRRPLLDPLPARYADFAAWQRESLTGEAQAQGLGYWKAALDGITPLELPLDRPRPAVWAPDGALALFRVPADVAERVLAAGRRRGATPFMTMLTAYALVLSRYAGRTDIPVGVPVSGRTHPETEGIVGFFLNSLVFRCDLSGDPGFAEALGRVRETSLSAMANQALPFDRLVEELAPERDLGRHPLYQVEFDMHDESWTGTRPRGEDLVAFQRAWTVAKSDLCLYLQREQDGSMAGAMEYATALFDRATVERFAGHLLRLLEAVADDASLPLPTPEEAGLPYEIPETGELGVRRPDGSVRGLGPRAELVRHRGVWINARRVEAALAAHEGVAEATLGAGDRLRAYWTAAPGKAAPADAELAAHCLSLLPADHVPAEFVRLAEGAVDEPQRTPIGPAERRIAEMWAQDLETDVDLDTSFFGLGGNSILAIRMIARIREEFGVEVPVRFFIEEATVSTLAAEVETLIREQLAELSDSEVLAELTSSPEAPEDCS